MEANCRALTCSGRVRFCGGVCFLVAATAMSITLVFCLNAAMCSGVSPMCFTPPHSFTWHRRHSEYFESFQHNQFVDNIYYNGKGPNALQGSPWLSCTFLTHEGCNFFGLPSLSLSLSLSEFLNQIVFLTLCQRNLQCLTTVDDKVRMYFKSHIPHLSC